jgi:hypothetical protein
MIFILQKQLHSVGRGAGGQVENIPRIWTDFLASLDRHRMIAHENQKRITAQAPTLVINSRWRSSTLHGYLQKMLPL